MSREFLITREEEAAIETAERLKENGFNAHIFSLFDLVINNPEMPNLSKYQALILTSKNALKFKPVSYWQEISKATQLLIVGQSFAKYLIDNSITNYQLFNDVEELVNYLGSKARSSYLYLRGKDISRDLQFLEHKIDELITYEIAVKKNMIAEELAKFIKEKKITDLLFFSKFSAKYFFTLLEDYKGLIDNCGIYCLSKNIADEMIGRKVNYPTAPNLSELIKIL